MTNEAIIYANRNWYKANLYFLSLHEEKGANRTFYHALMYMQDRKVWFNIYNPEVLEEVRRANPKEKVRVWFTLESKQYNNRWYTDVLLKHIEIPRIEELDKLREQAQTSSLNFGEGGVNF